MFFTFKLERGAVGLLLLSSMGDSFDLASCAVFFIYIDLLK